MNKLILTFLLLLPVVSVFADNCAVSERKLAIYYSNGMSNDEYDARNSLNAIELKTKSTLQSQGYRVSYDIAYNNNEVWYGQLFEIFRQRQLEQWRLFSRWLSGLAIAPDWFQQAMKNITQSINSLNYVIDTDLQRHVANYKSKIEACQRILIVAHSQGNFYANSAWDQIYGGKIDSDKYEMNRFHNIGLLAVATPAGHVGNQLRTENDHQAITSYVTLSNDWVINTLRVLGYSILPANYTNSHEDADWKHHAFVDSYLNGNMTGSVLLQSIQAIVNKLEVLPFARTTVVSSFLVSVGYQAEAKILEVEFVGIVNNRLYRYYDVPQATYEGFIVADSHGRYFNRHIRPAFTYRRMY